ncbi:glycosyltransferase family 2 protein [Bifidobacterium callitrichos]|uniref:Family 2 glycosyl transferase n=1 Tax=Bifidobacterium callitrichos DSM 23973 TaxID=1437609 RepID=A0A087A7C3_9BIFI|nr:glycosyltransferase [Bifidobacterium callitrichos]KFI54673.1 family 2 glycosyl transferase [Bifidobacterium callitrichos DSM 23973]
MIKGLLSVVVPVYNADKYIVSCINSILAQQVNMEILIIDDGSTDNSGDICRSLASDNQCVRYFKKQNGGVSSARNYGIEQSRGEFITFVDSDDSVCPYAYKTMLSLLLQDDSDIVCCGVNRVGNKAIQNTIIYNSDKPLKVSPNDAMYACLSQSFIGFTVYAKIFRISLFNDKPTVRFPLGTLMEEAYVLPYLFSRSHSISHTGEVGYRYYTRPYSYTTKPLSEECYAIFETVTRYKSILPKYYPGFDLTILFHWRVIQCINLYRTSLIQKCIIKNNVFIRVRREFWSIAWKALFSTNFSLKERLLLLETMSHMFLVRKFISSKVGKIVK